MSFIMKFSRTLNSQMKSHPDLYPLFAACVGAGVLAGYTSVYSFVSKADVSVNRWGNPRPCDKIDASKCTQKWATALKSDKDAYIHDTPVEDLRSQVYTAFDAAVPSVAHH
uniref:Uncharacterized protein n=1 Tax=Ciona savignyi TaxID=51511 RepID=H2ZB20_CIOSA